MGRGDKRTRRGKISSGSFGKFRVNPKEEKQKKKERRMAEGKTKATAKK